jgi:hypothetical protein
MIISGILNYPTTRSSLELLVVNICLDRPIPIEFDYAYDPEIKLKLIYNYLYELQLKQESPFFKEDLSNLFLETLFSLLKLKDPIEINFRIFYIIILAIDLIKPNDDKNIIRNLIRDAKFIHCKNQHFNSNLHFKLIDTYMGLISENENISFLDNYINTLLKSETDKEYFELITCALRFNLNFNTKSDYYNVLELIMYRCKNEDAFYKIFFSIDEYVRKKLSYLDFYQWYKTQTRIIAKKQSDKSSSLNVFNVFLLDWIERRKKIDNSKFINLILIEESLSNDEHNINKIINYLNIFLPPGPESKSESNIISKELTDLINYLKHIGYSIVEDEGKAETTNLFINKNDESVFDFDSTPNVVSINNQYFKEYYKNILLYTHSLN